MKHTADTLKWYLGREVYHVIKGGTVGKLKLTTKLLDKVYNKFFENSHSFYPILKTVEDLTEEESGTILCGYHNYHLEEKGRAFFNRNFTVNIQGDNMHNWKPMEELRPFEIMFLINEGFGAMPSKDFITRKDSPTGYVDLFGNPCVTPKMVDEGFEL